MLCEARKEAKMSQEYAAAMLSLDTHTLGRYEHSEVFPAGTAKMMARLYDKPEMVAWYCNCCCEIGRDLRALPTTIGGIAEITIKLCRDTDDARAMLRSLVEIAYDGQITPDEYEGLAKIIDKLDELEESILALKILASRHLPENLKNRHKKSRPFESGIKRSYEKRIAL